MPLPHTHSEQGGAEGQGGMEVAPAKARGWHQAEQGDAGKSTALAGIIWQSWGTHQKPTDNQGSWQNRL